MTSPKRLDADPARRLDEMRSAYDRLRAERIRAEGEVERLAQELDRVREEARAAFGTDDEAAIRRLLETAEAENAARVTEFDTTLRDIETRLRDLGGES